MHGYILILICMADLNIFIFHDYIIMGINGHGHITSFFNFYFLQCYTLQLIIVKYRKSLYYNYATIILLKLDLMCKAYFHKNGLMILKILIRCKNNF